MDMDRPISQKSTPAFVFKALIALGFSALSQLSPLEASALPPAPRVSDKASNHLYGAKLQFISGLGEDAAYSLNAEGATKGYRAAGTIGYAITGVDRVKLSLEYLQQKLGYQFSSGALEKRGLHQHAVGLAYERSLSKDWLDALRLSAFYSKASAGNLDSLDNGYEWLHRHLAGSKLYGASMGPSFKLFEGTSLALLANYDQLTIEQSLHAQRHHGGLGATVALGQDLGYGVMADLKAEFRRPFNAYSGSLTWDGLADGWLVGAFGAYTKGRLNLPDTTLFGLELTYCLGSKAPSAFSSTSIRSSTTAVESWVSSPAVYQPQLLVSTEEKAQSHPI